ncbi:MAG: hypothetical protein HQM09_22895 [Candidatus Riflebacteria bacterium]|nr:hypothetical protein [Candidatus Riflebacteria bacterium]
MIKEFLIAVVMTLIFSVGVGVLFVRTLLEMFEILINDRSDEPEESPVRNQHK